MNSAFNLKSSLQPVHLFELKSILISDLEQQINYIQQKSPQLLKNSSVVLDLNRLSQPITLAILSQWIDYLKQQCIHVMGVQSQDQQVKPLVQQLDLTYSQGNKTASKPSIDFKDSDIASKIITHPIRSGQQIYAANENLIILNNVGAGAEVIADGSITIFGALRGRAIAGAKGRENTQIICQSQTAELISIQGQYMVNEQLPRADVAFRFFLNDDRLQFEELINN